MDYKKFGFYSFGALALFYSYLLYVDFTYVGLFFTIIAICLSIKNLF